MFREHHFGPEQVYKAVGALDASNGFLKTGNGPAANTENPEKLIPKCLGFRIFAVLLGPLAGEPYRVLTYLIPTDRHSVFPRVSGAILTQAVIPQTFNAPGLYGGLAPTAFMELDEIAKTRYICFTDIILKACSLL